MLDLKQNIQFIKGVGPNRVTLLNKLGIFTIKLIEIINPVSWKPSTTLLSFLV